MKKIYSSALKHILLFSLVILLAGSCQLRQKYLAIRNNTDTAGVQFSGDTTKITVVTEKYVNGVVKSEVSARGNKREGLTKNYHEDGSLMSEVNYVNNQKEGISRDFYPKGKVRMEINYKQGLMDGDAKWYYETGEVYRLTPYIKGKAEGIQKEFYKNGKIKAELPHKAGVAITGLKEYDLNGALIPQPSIIIQEVDRIAMEGKFILKMHLSDKSDNVKWYEGDLLDWSYFPKALDVVNIDIDGNGVITYDVSPGTVVMKSIYIYAVLNTNMKNQLILKKKYELAYKGLKPS